MPATFIKNVEWIMPWAQYGKPEKGDEVVFNDEKALAMLLVNEVAFLNSPWWKKDWPEEAKAMTTAFVNCNDIFAWGCSDGEDLPFDQIKPLYKMWQKDEEWGAAVWCMVQRNQMPQGPVAKRIKDAGIWDLEKLGLGKNTQDDECQAYLASIIATIPTVTNSADA